MKRVKLYSPPIYPFDETQAYAINDRVSYDGKFYKFTAAHSTGVSWADSQVSALSDSDINCADEIPIEVYQIGSLDEDAIAVALA